MASQPLALSNIGSTIHHDVSWQEFEAFLAELGEQRIPRLAYDRGTLEIMVPLPEHEGYKEVFGDLIKDLADELDLDYESFGSTTWKRQDRLAGVEPDNCFYFQNELLVRGKLDINLEQDPPPDLVLEIDLTNHSLDKLPIYARLGVPEIWRYDRQALYIYQLQGDQYVKADTSLTFPTVPVKQIPQFIEQHLNQGRRELRKAFRVWVKKLLRAE